MQISRLINLKQNLVAHTPEWKMKARLKAKLPQFAVAFAGECLRENGVAVVVKNYEGLDL